MNFTPKRSAAWRQIASLVPVLLFVCCIGSAAADDKADAPKVIFSTPLFATPGQTLTLQLRGLRLDAADRVETVGANPAPEITLKKKEKSGQPNGMTAQQVGDSLVEIELKVPETFSADAIAFVVHTPAGASAPYRFLVIPKDQIVPEAEPNDELAKPQIIQPRLTINAGMEPKNPDVYSIVGKAGQKLHVEVLAARQGSSMDGILSIYDQAGTLLASIDDTPESADPILDLTLPHDGAYTITVLDALDRGGYTHAYLLRSRLD